MTALRELGAYARGRVCDIDDWGSVNPVLVRPAKTAAGIVVGVYFAASNVVKIQTRSGEVYNIRTDIT